MRKAANQSSYIAVFSICFVLIGVFTVPKTIVIAGNATPDPAAAKIDATSKSLSRVVEYVKILWLVVSKLLLKRDSVTDEERPQPSTFLLS